MDLTALNAFVAGGMREDRPGSYSITTNDPLAVAAGIHRWRESSGVTLSNFRITSASLEDVFLELTGSEVRD